MSEVAPLISDLASILMVAGVVTVLFKWLKQPTILGYIVAGIITGPSFSFFPTVSDTVNIKTWADIGVIFLLFTMGLDFSFKKLMNVGMTAVMATVTIVCGMMFLGYTAGNAMGFSHLSSLFLGGMLCMSSTAIVYKSFNDLGLMQQKFTSVVLGILVIEDLVAVLMMVILSTLAVSKHFEGAELLGSISKLAAFLISWSVLGIYFLPTLLKKIRRFVNDEILLIASLGLCLGMVMVAVHAGFSSALGAFVMGSLLAETVEAEKIANIVQPIKNLFAAIFFVSVGMMVDPGIIWEYKGSIIILVLLVLVGQVVFTSFGVLISGQPLKIAVQSGFSVTQVGEFAFIIASLGVTLKVMDSYLYPVIVAVSVITTFLTPYMIRCSGRAYELIDAHLPVTVKSFLARYASGNMNLVHKGTWYRLLKSMFAPVLLYSVVCVFCITLFFTYIFPLIHEKLPGWDGNLIGFGIISVVIAPFLWAIIMKKNHSPEFHKLWTDSKFNRGPLVSLIMFKIMLCLVIVSGVVIRLFNVAVVVGFVIALVFVGIIYFSKRVRARSLKIEQQFMRNFEEESDEQATASTIAEEMIQKHTPFKDMHMADFVIQPDSSFAGKSLKDTRIRTRFQLNVISIVRGDVRMEIPGSDVMLYPYDRVTAVGTDEQLNRFRDVLNSEKESYPGCTDASVPSDLVIESVCLNESSPVIGKSVSEANVSDSIILGIERDGECLVHPDSDMRFKVNDIVWFVGRREMVKKLPV